MSVPQRADELGRFRADAGVPAMLFSLLAGSTGLNLTARTQRFVPVGTPAGCDGVLAPQRAPA
jgi:hypothetical protein